MSSYRTKNKVTVTKVVIVCRGGKKGLCLKAHMFGDIHCLNKDFNTLIKLLHLVKITYRANDIFETADNRNENKN